MNYQLGLIGFPLGHSLSPKIQTAALKARGLHGDYSLFPISPEDKQGLKDLLARVRAGEIHGLNVTIPHKQNVIELMDELTPTAKFIGAVNTIYMRGKKLIGDNTDAPGFLSDLKRVMSVSQSKIENRKSAIVLGAGGSARAVVYALCNDGWNVTIAARRIEQAQQLAEAFTNYQLPITKSLQLSTFHFPLACQHHAFGNDPKHRGFSFARKYNPFTKHHNLRFSLQSTRNKFSERCPRTGMFSYDRLGNAHRTSCPRLRNMDRSHPAARSSLSSR